MSRLKEEKNRLQGQLEIADKKIAELERQLREFEERIQETTAQVEIETTPSAATKPKKEFGYIKKVYTSGGKEYLDIDYAVLFTGTEAVRAAREDGVIGPGEELDGEQYYIRNRNPRIRTFVISRDVAIKVETYNTATIENPDIYKGTLSYNKFKRVFATNDRNNQNMIVNPWYITIDDSIITKIEEQFIP